MPVSPDCNFVFLQDEYPYLAQSACIAESCMFTDPHNCIMKIGLLNEELCRLICKKSEIKIEKKDKFVQIVHKLKKHFFTEEDAETCLKIDEIIKSRNMVAHNLPRSEEALRKYTQIAEKILYAGYMISKNFYRRFINPGYLFPDFRIPVNYNESQTEISEKEDNAKTPVASCGGMIVGPFGLPAIACCIITPGLIDGIMNMDKKEIPPGSASKSGNEAVSGTAAVSGIIPGVFPDSLNRYFRFLDL